MSRKVNRLTLKVDGKIRYRRGNKSLISPYVYPFLKNVEFYRQSELEKYTIIDIEKAVFDAYGLTRDSFFVKRSRGARRDVKRMITYLLYEKTRMSFKEVSEYFGDKDHSSAIYNHGKFKELLVKEPQTHVKLNIVLNKLIKNGWEETEHQRLSEDVINLS